MPLTDRIAALIEPSLEAMGYELVRVRLSGGQRPTLQIMAERADRAEMTLDDCTEISRAVSPILDVEDPIQGAYSLEVSSPGIDRPLTRPQDYERFAGFEARLELSQAIEGQRRFKGKLLGLEADGVRLLTDEGEEVRLPLAEIGKAKLVFTDALLEAARRGH